MFRIDLQYPSSTLILLSLVASLSGCTPREELDTSRASQSVTTYGIPAGCLDDYEKMFQNQQLVQLLGGRDGGCRRLQTNGNRASWQMPFHNAVVHSPIHLVMLPMEGGDQQQLVFSPPDIRENKPKWGEHALEDMAAGLAKGSFRFASDEEADEIARIDSETATGWIELVTPISDVSGDAHVGYDLKSGSEVPVAYFAGLKWGLSQHLCGPLYGYQQTTPGYEVPKECQSAGGDQWVPYPLGMLLKRDIVDQPMRQRPESYVVQTDVGTYTWPPQHSELFQLPPYEPMISREKFEATVRSIIADPPRSKEINPGISVSLVISDPFTIWIEKDGQGSLIERDVFVLSENLLEFGIVPQMEYLEESPWDPSRSGVLVEYVFGIDPLYALWSSSWEYAFPSGQRGVVALEKKQWEDMFAAPMRSESGLKIGILDYLTGHPDRLHTDPSMSQWEIPKNVILQGSGALAAIDNEQADPTTGDIEVNKIFSINRREKTRIPEHVVDQLRAILPSNPSEEKRAMLDAFFDDWAVHQELARETVSCLLEERISLLVSLKRLPSQAQNDAVLDTCGVHPATHLIRRMQREGR